MGNIDSFFDRILVVNLDTRSDRWSLAQAELQICRIGKAERWPASVVLIDGKPHGHAGCTHSHRSIWRHVAEHGPDRVLVFEDDFKLLSTQDLILGGFRPGTKVWDTFHSMQGSLDERFATMAKHVPDDWDVLYLGGGYSGPPISRVHENVVRCGGMMTTSSYAFTRRFARDITQHLDEKSGNPVDPMAWHPGPVDSTLQGFAQSHKQYVFQPRLFIQRPSKSDITGETCSYLFSMTDPVHENMV